MSSKIFAQRFNRELSAMSLPTELADKIKAVSKVFGVTRHMANAMIFGHLLPDEPLLEKIGEILEVCPVWLAGKTDKRKAYTERESA